MIRVYLVDFAGGDIMLKGAFSLFRISSEHPAAETHWFAK